MVRVDSLLLPSVEAAENPIYQPYLFFNRQPFKIGGLCIQTRQKLPEEIWGPGKVKPDLQTQLLSVLRAEA